MYLVCKGTIKRENYKTKQEFYFFYCERKVGYMGAKCYGAQKD